MLFKFEQSQQHLNPLSQFRMLHAECKQHRIVYNMIHEQLTNRRVPGDKWLLQALVFQFWPFLDNGTPERTPLFAIMSVLAVKRDSNIKIRSCSNSSLTLLLQPGLWGMAQEHKMACGLKTIPSLHNPSNACQPFANMKFDSSIWLWSFSRTNNHVSSKLFHKEIQALEASSRLHWASSSQAWSSWGSHERSPLV